MTLSKEELRPSRLDNEQREATELQDREILSESQQGPTQPRPLPTSLGQSKRIKWCGHAVKKFWARQVAVETLHTECRNHFALERTYLGYLRTSLAFANLGIVVAQLFRLPHEQSTGVKTGIHALGTALACVFIGAAMFITMLGTFRFWRQQNALARGKVYAGGWEINMIAGIAFIITLAIFACIVAIDVTKHILVDLGASKLGENQTALPDSLSSE